ncbi:hypothetical protein GCM10023317_44010 [Actinopolymorpha pittospori]
MRGVPGRRSPSATAGFAGEQARRADGLHPYAGNDVPDRVADTHDRHGPADGLADTHAHADPDRVADTHNRPDADDLADTHDLPDADADADALAHLFAVAHGRPRARHRGL